MLGKFFVEPSPGAVANVIFQHLTTSARRFFIAHVDGYGVERAPDIIHKNNFEDFAMRMSSDEDFQGSRDKLPCYETKEMEREIIII